MCSSCLQWVAGIVVTLCVLCLSSWRNVVLETLAVAATAADDLFSNLMPDAVTKLYRCIAEIRIKAEIDAIGL